MAKHISKQPQPVQALHAFLKARWNGYDANSGPTFDIATFTGLLRTLDGILETADWEAADQALQHLPLFDAFLANPRYAGHGSHLDNLQNAIAKRSADKARLHLHRLRKVVRPVAADRRFADGQRVSITRTEHGWFDGRLGGTVKPGSGGYVVEGDDGYEHEIAHLRDIN